MTKLRHLEPYGFNEQPQFNGLVNTVKANIENIKKKNEEQDEKDVEQDANITQVTSTLTNSLNQKLGSGFTGDNSANTVTSVIETNEKITASALNDLNDRKADLSALTAHISDSEKHITTDERTKWNGKISNAEYNGTDKKIYFYSGATKENPVSTIDATNFIKDGMVSKVEIKDVTNSGSCLVITFNADAGNEVITIPVSKIFNPANYYLKTETSGKTELDTAFGLKANTSELTKYYKKEETSGKTELDTAFGLKANTTDLTTHISDNIKHITSDERTKWNDAATNSHTHANKSVLDTITAIDKELSETSNNLVVNSAITKVIEDNEKITSASLNDLNERKLDASAYTPTDLSDYYKKEETSAKTELDAALTLKANTSDLATKANTSDLTAHTGNSTVHITADERTKWDGAATTLASHTGDSTVHITSAERTKWDNAVTSSHTHANKAILDTITAIDTELSETSNNLVVNSAITKVIVANEKISSSALNDLNDRKLDASAYTPTDLSDYYKKEETSGKSELTTAFNSKANSADLTTHTSNSAIHITADERSKWNGKISDVQYNNNSIKFYSGATTETPVSTIDVTPFIKDGMVSNVEIKNVASSGSCLVITFNTDANKQDINIPVSTIFNPANYYLKTDTSGKTEISSAFSLKADTSALTAHTNDSTIHHTHANKDVLDNITAIDTELSKTSGNLVVNSAITKVIVDNEKIVSASLNDLNDRKLDASAYTPTDLSDYYKKEETSGKTELDAALAAKANTGHTHTSNDITDKVTEITGSNSGSTSVPTVSAVMQKLNELNATITQLQTTVQDYKTRIEALEGKNSNNASQS